jgi:hypothetical protein
MELVNLSDDAWGDNCLGLLVANWVDNRGAQGRIQIDDATLAGFLQ